jgi:DNA-binding protein H-NS
MTQRILRQLLVERDALDAQIASMRAELRDGVLEELKARIEEFEFTAFELGLVKTQHIGRHWKEIRTFQAKAKSQPCPPLYRNPATGKTWSGRGRAPRWIDGNRDEYLIQDDDHGHRGVESRAQYRVAHA